MMVQVPRIKLWRVPYSQITYSTFGVLEFYNKNQIIKQRESKRVDREKRKKRNLT
jgi:hypothetical protein